MTIFVLYFTLLWMLNPKVMGGRKHSQNGEPDSADPLSYQLILCPMRLISDMPGGFTLHNVHTKPKPELKEYHEK